MQGEVRTSPPTNLRCEYLTEPLAVATAKPRFSWEFHDPRRAARQTAYEIQVAGSRDRLATDSPDIWNSGKVPSSENHLVEYGGAPLRSFQECWWRVRVWDADDVPTDWSAPARFAMGVLDPAEWKARWIADPTPVPVFRPARNGFHSRLLDAPDVVREVTIDLGQLAQVDAVRLYPARPFDWPDTPGFLYPLRFRISVAEDESFERAVTVVDQTGGDEENPGDSPRTYRFPKHECRYVRLQVTRCAQRLQSEFAFALAEMQVLHGETVLSEGATVSSADSIETEHWSTRYLTDGELTSHGPSGTEPLPAPMLRREIVLERPIRRAMAYATALGLYELYLNGKRVGDQVLAPEWTDYHKRVQYQAYDVTELMKRGVNVFGVVLADGWYCGRLGLAGVVPGGPPRRIYGPTPAFFMQVMLECEDGTREILVSDGQWRSTREGPWRKTDLLDGVTYDARREMPGWLEPGYDVSSWSSVRVESPGVLLSPQPNEPIRVVREVPPVSIVSLGPTRFLVDFGQNLTGWCKLEASAPRGTTVTLRHGEMKDEKGELYIANLRSARQEDSYVFRGEGKEVFEPRFTYHGFRYVEVEGLHEEPSITACVVHSAPPETMQFECSDPQLNRLVQNILWTQRSNMHSIPTDCPQRDERLGWTGDILAFAETALFNMDMAAFLGKWLRDLREAQTEDGRFGDVAPHAYGPDVRFSGAPAWADAGVFVPWSLYVRYGDERMLSEHYEAARKWVEFVHSKNPDGIWRHHRGNDYGDWLNSDTLVLPDMPKVPGEMPKEAFATAFMARSTQLLAKMARVLGKSEDAERYEKLWARARSAFLREYVGPDGKIRGDTQAGYAIALEFELLPEDLREQVLEHLLEAIQAYRGHLTTGFHATRCLMNQLTEGGRSDVAYALLNNRTPPSWLYPIEQGATTIWERWDGYVAGRGFQNPGMNSFSHYAFGCIGEWIYKVVAGIRPVEEGDAMRIFDICPVPGGGLTWAKAEYRSVRGPIRTYWKLEGDQFTLEVTVPPGCAARVLVPSKSPPNVLESGRPLPEAMGVRVLAVEEGGVRCVVQSGSYQFTAPAR